MQLTYMIENQIKSNIFKNIFLNDFNNFYFNNNIRSIIFEIKSNQFDERISKEIINICINNLLNNLYTYNQYLHFNLKQIKDLKTIYKQLYFDIKNLDSYISIERNHFNRLKEFFIESGLFQDEILNCSDEKLPIYINEEYSGLFQLDILNIHLINEPVLDIGCGSKTNLLNYLNEINIEAYGIDRCSNNTKSTFKKDWLIFDYGNNKWGTIISNMSFTNHFLFHYTNKNDTTEYTLTYYKILNSLKINGIWYYAPSLLFIEESLPKDKYQVINEEINETFKRTKIIKLK